MFILKCPMVCTKNWFIAHLSILQLVLASLQVLYIAHGGILEDIAKTETVFLLVSLEVVTEYLYML